MLDWIAGAFELSGSYLVGNKNRLGFALSAVGCLVWVYIAIKTRLFGLLLVVVPAILINIRNLIKWRS